MLEGSLGLLLDGPLLLESGLCFLECTLLLPDLLPHCCKRDDLVRQVGPQLLGLFGLLLSLTLPRPCPLRVARSCWS
jgi:hypothetical protein